ncbi:hypothetical protein C5E10_05055 [Pseudoclavibacter sp. RFBG4]|uniref:hypothetical protein n=1 Tax=Pseudoclavibacter sp. RFBG4 TaxID=2080575 RepID=UPI000CE876C1|nr:hypothetical protein [Pseudoclavibacter sp. RFBG4]PPG34973.1 hypothetical protein C5E10_05055 [Pseudoclavibacter sp. RFBG4]
MIAMLLNVHDERGERQTERVAQRVDLKQEDQVRMVMVFVAQVTSSPDAGRVSGRDGSAPNLFRRAEKTQRFVFSEQDSPHPEGASARTAASEVKATTTCKQRLPGPVALMHLARDRRLEMKDAAWL